MGGMIISVAFGCFFLGMIFAHIIESENEMIERHNNERLIQEIKRKNEEMKKHNDVEQHPKVCDAKPDDMFLHVAQALRDTFLDD